MSSVQDTQSFHWQYYNEFDDKNYKIHGHALFFLVMLFSLLLLLTLLFLYTRWICRHNPATTASNSVAHAPPPTPLGLDSNEINNLPLISYYPRGPPDNNNNNMELTECSICLGIFTDGEKVKVLPSCRHCYHSECVDKWLITHSTCPLCRASLRPDIVSCIINAN